MQKIFSSIAIAFVVALAIGSCKKGDVVSDFTANGTGTYLTLVKTNNVTIDYSNLATAKVSITVQEKGDPLEKIVVYVTKGAANLNRSAWKKVKEVPYSGETTLEVSATEMATALGIPPAGLETGATYTFYNQGVTKSGNIHDAANTNSAYQGLSAYNMALTWSAVVICPFNPAGFPGDFEVLEDTWGDYTPGEIVTVNSATANSIMLTAYPSPAYGSVNQKAVKVDITPATGKATVTNQIYGDYPQFGIIDTRLNTVGSNNWVFSCAGTITLRMNHNGITAGGNQGDYTLRLRKKP